MEILLQFIQGREIVITNQCTYACFTIIPSEHCCNQEPNQQSKKKKAKFSVLNKSQ